MIRGRWDESAACINTLHITSSTEHNTCLDIFPITDMSSSCCGGNCGCGSGCKCGNGCGGCKMYPDMTSAENTTTETLLFGVATNKTVSETSGAAGAENGGCKCNPCTCHPCTCK